MFRIKIHSLSLSELFTNFLKNSVALKKPLEIIHIFGGVKFI